MSRLAARTWSEVGTFAQEDPATRRPAVLLVPVGSTEQHGPHLPLSTDTDLADALADRAVARLAGAVVAPAVAYGSSGEHQDFPGTLSIGAEVTEALLVELARSALRTFERVVFVSTHGGNATPVSRAVGSFPTGDGRGRQVRSWSPRWTTYREGDAETSVDLHAGRVETSLMLAVAPERVRLELAGAGVSIEAGTLIPVLRRRGVRQVSPNGVLGDPTGASADEGRRLLDAATDDLVAFVERGRAGSGPDKEDVPWPE